MKQINGRAFRVLVAEHGYTLRNFSRVSGIGQPTLNRFAHGKGGRLDTLARAAKALDMSLSDLLKAVEA